MKFGCFLQTLFEDGPICSVELPRAGLGNKLLIWARAYLFAQRNDLPIISRGWCHLHVGPILRGERNRFYWRYFRRPRNFVALIVRRQLSKRKVFDPSPEITIDKQNYIGTTFVFRKLPHFSDYFADLRDHRGQLMAVIHAMLRRRYAAQLASLAPPIIGLHVRRGDFKIIGATTPIDYFTAVIEGVRHLLQRTIPVTVFSDAPDEELAPLLALPVIARSQPAADIVDLLLLSRSKVLICSAGSTFSYWAAFLSEASVIGPPDASLGKIRPDSLKSCWFEGTVDIRNYDQWPPLLVRNLKEALS